jgi:hypothetical protein
MLDRALERVAPSCGDLDFAHLETARWLAQQQTVDRPSQASLAMCHNVCGEHAEKMRRHLCAEQPDLAAAVYFLHQLALTCAHPETTMHGERLSIRASQQAVLVAQFCAPRGDWGEARRREIEAQRADREALLPGIGEVAS